MAGELPSSDEESLLSVLKRGQQGLQLQLGLCPHSWTHLPDSWGGCPALLSAPSNNASLRDLPAGRGFDYYNVCISVVTWTHFSMSWSIKWPFAKGLCSSRRPLFACLILPQLIPCMVFCGVKGLLRADFAPPDTTDCVSELEGSPRAAVSTKIIYLPRESRRTTSP